MAQAQETTWWPTKCQGQWRQHHEEAMNTFANAFTAVEETSSLPQQVPNVEFVQDYSPLPPPPLHSHINTPPTSPTSENSSAIKQ